MEGVGRCSALVALLLSGSGCHALLGIDDFATVDASIDGPLESDGPPIDGTACFGTLVPICLPTTPSGTVILAGALDTATDPRCVVVSQVGAPELCVIAAANLSIENTQVTGSRALVLIGGAAVTINAILDASSTRAGIVGAAASTTACASTQVGASGGDAGGGAGGSFGTVGGNGGAGGPGGVGNAGGQAPAIISVTAIRGGCAGGKGGAGGGQSAGALGPSGGAIAIYSGSQIAIIAAGAVYASGAGGGAGSVAGSAGGGGGGGSGGLIVLDAPSIQILGTVAANGGGGGGGGDSGQGNPGGDGTTSSYNLAATGGLGQASDRGGVGGKGAALALGATVGASPPNSGGGPGVGGGGGGGGGGVGAVWMHGSLAGGTKISPAPQVH